MQDDDSTFYLAAHFSGRVQGVGFRYQAYNIAKGYEVTGFVRNLADGRVQMGLEGQENEVRKFVAEIVEQMDGLIHDVETEYGHRQREFTGFTIR